MIILALSAALLASTQAYALSPIPEECAPRIEAQPVRMSCPTKSGNYDISIKILLSPEGCVGDDFFVVETASVKKFENARLTEDFTIYSGRFSYDLHEATFSSEQKNLHLTDCVDPNQ